MNEGVPTGIPTPEGIPTKEEILAKLRVEGLTEENLAMVVRWTEAREKEVHDARGTIELNIERIQFYVSANDDEGARECLKDAYENAIREGQNDIVQHLDLVYGQILDEIFK